MSHQVTLNDAEVALAASVSTPVIPAGRAFSAALVFNKDAAATVYMTADGTAASATNGMPIAPGTGYEFPHNALPQAAVNVFSTGTPRVFSQWG